MVPVRRETISTESASVLIQTQIENSEREFSTKNV
jgi:hypothetical protein